jgi:outer membrane protein assembly factor BamB
MTVWIRRYNGGHRRADLANALGVSPDGARVYVTGYSQGPNFTTDAATLAYDTDSGTRLWVRRTSAPSGGAVTADALGVSPDGTMVFVTGQSSAGQGDYATFAYDAGSGAKLWSRRYNGPFGEGDAAQALAVSPDGARVYVTGYSQGSAVASDSDYATIAYDAATGTSVWTRRYDGPRDDYDIPQAVAVGPDGGHVYVTGGSADGPANLGGFAYATIAYPAAP